MKNALTVTEINRAIKSTLENSFPYPIEVEGEISNFRPHFSGHAYFSLKDTFSQLACVMWRSKLHQAESLLENGQKVVCSGTVTVYEKTGRYQINVIKIRALGQGDLQARMDALKQKLWQEGLFDEARKRHLPAFPKRIGLITSPTGAAIRDMISVAQRRNPNIELIVRPSQVQGEKAAPDLIKALSELNDWGGVDVIIIGRGGGSLEDLWAFNDEALARAIYHSKIPVVSAVGHEIDISISDLVADHRAATPSEAAEMAVPPQSEMHAQLLYYEEKSNYLIRQTLSHLQQKLLTYKNHRALQTPQILLKQKQERLLQSQHRLAQSYHHLLEQKRVQLKHLQEQITALNPRNVLERGYVIVEQSGQPIRSKEDLQNGSALLHFANGTAKIHLEIEN